MRPNPTGVTPRPTHSVKTSALASVASLAGWSGPLVLAAYELWRLRETRLGPDGAILWAVLAALGLVGVTLWRRRLTVSPAEVMVAGVLAAALVGDLASSNAGALRDLRLYLRAGEHFAAGVGVYMTVPISVYPADGAALPFLYPPPVLPFFGLLAQLPFPLVAATWVAGSTALMVWSLRAIGLSWRWAVIALLWPPIEQGIFVGNVALPAFALLAMAPRLASGLVLGPLLKPQSGILALWLLGERKGRSLIVGLASVVAIVLSSLPLTGIARWSEWRAGLQAYEDSQHLLPGLYGVGLDRWLPMPLVVLLAGLAIGLALSVKGRESLTRLGLASVIASPSVWSHGFLVVIPAFLRLRTPWLWLVVGLLCAGTSPGPQIALALTVLGWLVPGLVRGEAQAHDANARLHPLGAEVDPWPGYGEVSGRTNARSARGPGVHRSVERRRREAASAPRDGS